MINKILKTLVEDYQQKEWEIEQRDIGFFKAREELLSGAGIHIFKYESDVVLSVRTTGCDIPLPNPLIANIHGRIAHMFYYKQLDINIETSFTIAVINKDGIMLIRENVTV